MEITKRVVNRGVGGEEGVKVQRISSINDRWKIDRGRVTIVRKCRSQRTCKYDPWT